MAFATAYIYHPSFPATILALNIYAMIWVAQRRGMDGVNALRRALGRVARAFSGLPPTGPVDPWILWWIALALLLPLLLAR
jgi:hypothetical protein